MIDSCASRYACPVRFFEANLHVRSTCFMGRKTVMNSLVPIYAPECGGRGYPSTVPFYRTL